MAINKELTMVNVTNSIILLRYCLFALLLALAMTTPTYAAPINPHNQGTISQKDLEKEGYKCEVVSLGFVECRKGQKVYWCSYGECTEKLSRPTAPSRPWYRAENNQIQGQIYEVLPYYPLPRPTATTPAYRAAP
jgi:hypothetical protein